MTTCLRCMEGSLLMQMWLMEMVCKASSFALNEIS